MRHDKSLPRSLNSQLQKFQQKWNITLTRRATGEAKEKVPIGVDGYGFHWEVNVSWYLEGKIKVIDKLRFTTVGPNWPSGFYTWFLTIPLMKRLIFISFKKACLLQAIELIKDCLNKLFVIIADCFPLFI